MLRRDILCALGKLAALSLVWPFKAHSQVPAPLRKRVEIDEWTFALLVDWVQKESKHEELKYFEAEDGSKGCYVEAMTFVGPNSRTSAELAKSLQETSSWMLKNMKGYGWRVMRNEAFSRGSVVISISDCFDEKNKYRILSEVHALSPRALAVRFHDYDCESYEKSSEYFAPIAASIRHRAV